MDFRFIDPFSMTRGSLDNGSIETPADRKSDGLLLIPGQTTLGDLEQDALITQHTTAFPNIGIKTPDIPKQNVLATPGEKRPSIFQQGKLDLEKSAAKSPLGKRVVEKFISEKKIELPKIDPTLALLGGMFVFFLMIRK